MEGNTVRHLIKAGLLLLVAFGLLTNALGVRDAAALALTAFSTWFGEHFGSVIVQSLAN
ncbi:hypothetical protein ACFUMH_01805 [Cellulomonas sp. NPDC057328]|uniref:hypothetical protein n=1 Tax=Cellulomonas sp. NPDC057328 TaxID=3346101 RepID=UPI00363576B5